MVIILILIIIIIIIGLIGLAVKKFHSKHTLMLVFAGESFFRNLCLTVIV